MGEDRSLGLELSGIDRGWSDPFGDTIVRPRQQVLGVQSIAVNYLKLLLKLLHYSKF